MRAIISAWDEGRNVRGVWGWNFFEEALVHGCAGLEFFNDCGVIKI